MIAKVLHLSDPHFGTNYADVLSSLYQSINELKPDLIIMSGDITQRARKSQFQAAAEFVKSLSAYQWLIVPGNHDIPLFNIFDRLFKPYRHFHSVFGEILEKQINIRNIEVFALNSTSRFRHIQGALNKKQIKSLVASHQTLPTGVRIACFHHPMDCSQNVDDKNLLRNRHESMKVFAQQKIDLILGGHIHDPYVSLSGERYPEVSRQSIISVAGTCLSWRTRAGAPNSFHFIEIEQDDHQEPRLNIARYDINENKRFLPIRVQRFIRDKVTGWSKL